MAKRVKKATGPKAKDFRAGMAKRVKKGEDAKVQAGLDMDPKKMKRGKRKAAGPAPDGFLFNVDSKHAKKIRLLAQDYQGVKKERVALLAEEVKLKTELISFVLKSEAPVDPKDAHREIRAGDVVVRITPDEKMKVKITFDGDVSEE